MQIRDLLAATSITELFSEFMRRPHLQLRAGLLTVAILVAGCGSAPDHDAAGSMAASASSANAESATAPSATAASPQDREVLNIVDAYIREHTMEGAPYFIDSSATEFAGFDGDVVRENGRAVCRAKFTSEKDVYYVQFDLAKEMGQFVIRRVVLEKLNQVPLRKTLYNREALVL